MGSDYNEKEHSELIMKNVEELVAKYFEKTLREKSKGIEGTVVRLLEEERLRSPIESNKNLRDSLTYREDMISLSAGLERIEDVLTEDVIRGILRRVFKEVYETDYSQKEFDI